MVGRGHYFNHGLIMRAVGNGMVITLPLLVSKQKIDALVSKARHCLDLTARSLRGIICLQSAPRWV